jgi:hypothetical protein
MKNSQRRAIGCSILFVFTSLVCVVSAIFLVGGFWRSVPISDVDRPTEFTVTHDNSDISPFGTNGISVWVVGEITGEAELWAENWTPLRLSGRVNARVYHDWFTDDCTLNYKPLGPVSGRLTVYYQFH